MANEASRGQSTRSRMLGHILALIDCGAITAASLAGFSDDLREAVAVFLASHAGQHRP